MPDDVPDFASLGLREELLQTLREVGYETPTPIQAATIPPLLAGRDVVGLAQTGTGKTAAFALPVLDRLDLTQKKPQALVLAPTRELALQVCEAFEHYASGTPGVKVLPVYGGQSYGVQLSALRRGVHVVVGTPGRVIDHLNRGTLDLSELRFLVLDEADQILDAGFLPAIRRILKGCPAERQLALFTATASDSVRSLISELFDDALVVETEGRHRPVSTLTTVNINVPGGRRFPVLESLLDESVEGGTLIFTNTRGQCDELAEALVEAGYRCAVYRGDMDKLERRRNLRDFRDGALPVLISTDLAARGLDVESIGRVINYHLPRELKNYLHRAGRTARAGKPGTVVNLVTPRDRNLIKRLGE